MALSVFGTLPAWLTLGAVVGAAWVFSRGGGGTAIATLVEANRVLEKRVHEQDLKISDQDKVIAELRGRTDLSLSLKPIIDWTSLHDQRAQERHDKTLLVLDLIAERLGPDTHP
jgi:hypothetical protein